MRRRALDLTIVTLVTVVLAAACALYAGAQDPPPAPPPQTQPAPPALTAAEEFAALEAGLDASKLGYIEKWKAFKPKYEAFAARYPATEEALCATLWLLEQTWWEREAGTMNDSARKLADHIIATWPTSENLSWLVEYQFVFSADDRNRIFGWLLDHSPHRPVKAAALFGLAAVERRDRDADVRARGTARLQRLIDEFADVKWRYSTFGAIAAATLHPHAPADLAIGKPAPEIMGRAHDGTAMKLSDYRGKVVVLDFWGHW
ncbi:MAG: TlpA family protein disulfide reductase [Planctomycetota bacterium]